MTPERAALLQAATDRQCAEDFLIEPTAPGAAGSAAPGQQWTDVNARPMADPLRAATHFSAIWSAPSVESNRRPRLDMESARQGTLRQISAARPVVKLQDDALPFAPSVGDRVTRTASGERYAVGGISGDGFGRTLLSLTARGT